jgi:nicotinamidase-related amidase
LPNAFAGISLEDELAKIGRSELIVCGFMTHMCVSSTVRAALDLGYRNTIISNTCATRNLPRVGGGVIDATELHDASLAALADRFSVVVRDESEIST